MRRLRAGQFVLGLAMAATLSSCSVRTPLSSSASARSSTAVPATPARPTPVAPPQSWVKNGTLLTIYGRQFDDTPILGRLGFDKNFDDLRRQVAPYWRGMHEFNGGKPIRVALHLIYAIATPCAGTATCLGYLDDQVDIVRRYIKPAAARGLLVVLDDQLGLSNPVAEVRRMISKGYLAYDNVAVALDPEFRARPGQDVPGIPVGTVSADELNAAQAFINREATVHHLRHKKVMIVHQFRDFMIEGRQKLRADVPYVDTVIVADGFGSPATKADVYDSVLAPKAAGVRYRGIKLFYPNPLEQAGHFDDPMLTWPQVFGRSWIYEAGSRFAIYPVPCIVVIA